MKHYFIAAADGEIIQSGTAQESVLPGVLNLIVPDGCTVHRDDWGVKAGAWYWDGEKAVEKPRLEELIVPDWEAGIFNGIPPGAMQTTEDLGKGRTRHTFTLDGYVPVEFVTEAPEHKAGRAAARADAVLNMTPAQIDAWVDTNVTDMASAKEALKKLAKLVVFLNR